MSKIKSVCGDDLSLVITLKSNGSVDVINLSSVIKAVLARNHEESSSVTPVSNDQNADWPNGVVAVNFPGTATIDLKPGDYDLHISVSFNGKTRTWVSENLVKMLEKHIP